MSHFDSCCFFVLSHILKLNWAPAFLTTSSSTLCFPTRRSLWKSSPCGLHFILLIIIIGAANSVTGQKRNLLALAKTWYNQLSLNTLKLMQANKAVCGFHLGYIPDEQLISRTMYKLLELYEQGKIKPRIDSCYHFEEVSLIMLL